MSRPAVIQALLDPAAYPPDEAAVEIGIQETHISWLLFTGRHVYKVKKPVDFGFLDFSTLEDRHTYCQEEVRLNRRLSPSVYLGVVEIREKDGRYRIEGPGTTVEYAVKMRQLPHDRWLAELLSRGEADEQLMRRIARRIADFHAGAATDQTITRIGGLETVRRNAAENFEQTRKYVGRTLARATFDVVRAYTEAFLEVREGVFARRAADGRVRDCHGDLHVGQVCVENGIDFIDCIEFNQRFRYSDVAADLAFLAMDLDHYERPDLSATLVDEYVAATGDEGLREVLDFYKCYRAYTRGKVTSFLLDDPDLDDGRRRRHEEQAASYFELARRYAHLEEPLLVVTAGLMGAGKTSLARSLGARLDAGVIDSDVVRKELAGLAPDERRFEGWGEGIYSAEHTARTYGELHRRAAAALEGGERVILDASYRERDWRAAARRAAREAGAGFLVVEVSAPDRILRQRLATRHGPAREEAGQRLAAGAPAPAPAGNALLEYGAGDDELPPALEASDGRLEILDRQRRTFESISEVPDRELVAVDTSGPRPENVYRALLEIYRRRLAAD